MPKEMETRSDDLYETVSYCGGGGGGRSRSRSRRITANDVCNVSIATANLAGLATVTPANPPIGRVVTGVVAITGVVTASIACPLAGRNSF